MNKQIQKVYNDIKTIKVQGATNIAMAVLKTLREYGRRLDIKKNSDFIKEIKVTGQYLVSARETEPMAGNVLDFVLFYLTKNKDVTPVELKQTLIDSIDYFQVMLDQNNKKISKYGEKLIKFGDKIFTHCHASTVISIFKLAKINKKHFEVFQTETRPLYQGHRTALELNKLKIKNTLIIDSAASFLISNLSGKKFQVDKVIIGCDSIALDGSCVNKIGSFGIAETAYLSRIPLYVATQALKIDEDAKNLKAIRIEQREASEVWDKAPKGLKIYNPAFDVVPAKYITGYVTEFGVIRPEDLIKNIKKIYTWLIK